MEPKAIVLIVLIICIQVGVLFSLWSDKHDMRGNGGGGVW